MTTRLSERLVRPTALADSSPRKSPSAARERILTAAGRLFYDEGIHAVGVERVITAADVSRVTFYRHFPSKDALIEAYLRARGDRMRERIAAVRGADDADPRKTLDAVAETLVDDRSGAGFRGCEFVNAAAEYADTAHPARTVTVLQRGWLMDVTAEALGQLGHPRPRRLARQLLMLRTGASVASDLDNGEDIGEVFLEAWQAMLAAGLAAGSTAG